MILEQKVKVRWNGASKKHYESLGYIWTKVGDEFEVDIEDVTLGSNVLVEFICDYCGGSNQADEESKWRKYVFLLKQRKTTQKDCCNHKECLSIKLSESQLSKPFLSKDSLAEKFPHLIEEWSDKNKKSPWDYSYGSNVIVWWKCSKGHNYDMSIKNKANEYNCPYCSGKRIDETNCLASLRPDIVKEWNYNKNNHLTPYDVTIGSDKIVWWVCQKGHEWDMKIDDRVRVGHNCPFCSNKRVCLDNCLATLHPLASKEWHPTKNKKLTPFDVTPKSGKKVWWYREECGHEWDCKVSDRISQNTGCPYCSGRKVCLDNCLSTIYPEIASEWHPTRNGELTPFDVTSKSSKKTWWKCTNNHEWEAVIRNRTGNNKTSCPICNESKGEKEIRLFLELNNIFFKSQYEFNDLIGVNDGLLRFDFAIFAKGSLELLIEYDGEFHYEKIFEDDGHETIVEHDKRKNEYYLTHNIPLLRIPYWDFDNIEKILTEELNKYSLLLNKNVQKD